METPILSLLLFHGIFAAFVMLCLNQCSELIQKIVALVLSFSGVLLAVNLVFLYVPSVGFQWVEQASWIPSIGAMYHLGADGISVGLIVLTFFVVFVSVCAVCCMESGQLLQVFALVFFTQAMTIGVFCALDGLLFYFFWEAGLLPMYLYIGRFGGEQRQHASKKYFLFTFFGSILFLVSILYLGYRCGGFSLLSFYQASLTFQEQQWLFVAFTLAFAIKLPMFPVHSWLPDAHTQASTAGSMLLAAILLKLGGYGFLRFNLPITPDASYFFAPWMVSVSLIAIIYIGFVAVVQLDVKRLIAYASISHMGMVTLGIFLVYLMPENSQNYQKMSLIGSVFHMISHGFTSSALFLAFGMLYSRMGSRMLTDYGGIMRVMPVLSAFFMLYVLSNIGFPGTGGFVGDFLILLSAVATDFRIAVIAVFTLLLSAAYSLNLVRHVFYGKVTNIKALSLVDIGVSEKLLLMGLSVVILVIGLYPECVVSISEVSIVELLSLAVVRKV